MWQHSQGPQPVELSGVTRLVAVHAFLDCRWSTDWFCFVQLVSGSTYVDIFGVLVGRRERLLMNMRMISVHVLHPRINFLNDTEHQTGSNMGTSLLL